MNQKGFSNVLLVIIGVVIGLAAIGFFTVKNSAPKSDNSTPYPVSDGANPTQLAPISTPPAPAPSGPAVACGISIDSPVINEVVGPIINVSGSIDGACHWTPFEGQAGTVRAYNSNGQPVSSTEILTVSGNWMQLPVNFTAKVTINTPPHTATGYLLFMNENPSDQFPETYQLPIHF